MLTAHVEDISQSVEEIKSLIPSHYNEISEHKLRGIPLDPDYDFFLKRNAAGEVIFVALRESGKLIGYLISFVAPGHHYQSCLTCISDIFYVYPDQRGLHGGILLFGEWMKECERRGVDLMAAGFKTKHAKYVRPLFEAMGFFEAEVIFWKFLDKEPA